MGPLTPGQWKVAVGTQIWSALDHVISTKCITSMDLGIVTPTTSYSFLGIGNAILPDKIHSFSLVRAVNYNQHQEPTQRSLVFASVYCY